MASAEGTLSFFKDTIPAIYTTDINMCVLRPGDVLLLPPRYSSASFRATSSVDLSIRFPGIVIPFSKNNEAADDKQ